MQPDTMQFIAMAYPAGWSVCSETAESGSVVTDDQAVICENQYMSSYVLPSVNQWLNDVNYVNRNWVSILNNCSKGTVHV